MRHYAKGLTRIQAPTDFLSVIFFLSAIILHVLTAKYYHRSLSTCHRQTSLLL